MAVLRRRFPDPVEGGRERERALGVLLRKGYDTELALEALARHALGPQTTSARSAGVGDPTGRRLECRGRAMTGRLASSGLGGCGRRDLCDGAAAAQAATGAAIRPGRTSQGRAVSFRVAGDRLAALRFAINVVCPSRRVWEVRGGGVGADQDRHSRFAQTIASHRPGASGRATIRGELRRGT